MRSVYLSASLCAAFAASSIFSELSFAAKIQPVYSLKNLGDHQSASGETFKKIQIKCNTGPEPRFIHQLKGSDQWCVNGNSGNCSSERIDAATVACNMKSASVVNTPIEAKVAAPTPEQVQASAERQKLEQELIANQQRKIELRERQLELRKRELQLRQEQEQFN